MPCHKHFRRCFLIKLFPGNSRKFRIQLLRNRFCKCLLCRHRIISVRSKKSNLIFHLHHQHSMLLSILFFQEFHQPTERFLISPNGLLAKRRHGIRKDSSGVTRTLKPVCIPFHPFRNVTALTVLPETEPQKYKPHLLFSRLLQNAFRKREIKTIFLGFYSFPGNRHD